MEAPKSVLAATDFSAHAQNAVLRAGQIATVHDAALELLHVMSAASLRSVRGLFGRPEAASGKLAAEVRRALGKAARELPASSRRTVTTRLSIGSVLDEILKAERRAGLLVLGDRGTSPVRDMILGTTAERLLGRCAAPALVVKRAPRGPYRRVLVPVDFSSVSARTLETAARLAPDADLYICHAFEVPFESMLRRAGVSNDQVHAYRSQARQQALARIHGLIDGASALGPRHFAAFVGHGDAGRVILDKASATNVDLIAVGKRRRSALEDLLLGSVTRRVLADAECDVLVVNEKAAGGRRR